MRTLFIYPVLVTSLCLSACQPKHQTAEEQQNFICRTLIDGFLETQALTNYQLDRNQPIPTSSANNVIYVYMAQQHSQLNMMPQRAQLQFNCQKLSARKFQIKLHDPQQPKIDSPVLLHIQLPEQQQLKTFIVSSAVPPKLALLK